MLFISNTLNSLPAFLQERRQAVEADLRARAEARQDIAGISFPCARVGDHQGNGSVSFKWSGFALRFKSLETTLTLQRESFV